MRSTCSALPFFSASNITVEAICHDTPYLSFSQPHWPASPSAAFDEIQLGFTVIDQDVH